MPGENIMDWSATAANNATADSSINWAEGMARAAVNNSARSMMAAIAKYRNLLNGSILTGGTANAQTFTSGVGFTSVPTGLVVRLLIPGGLTNTASASLNMDGIGAVTIKSMYNADLIGGELVAGTYRDFLYNGTNWILLNAGFSGVATQFAPTSAALVSAGSPGKMLGYGSTCFFTPTKSSRARITWTGAFVTDTTGIRGFLNARASTGGAPANGAAATGTIIDRTNHIFADFAASQLMIPAAIDVIATGFVIGTQYWLDLSCGSGGGTGSQALQTAVCTVQEI